MAMRPQIIKSYAIGQKNDMLKTMFYGAKGTYFLMYVFTLPLMLEMPALLEVWLKHPPEYAILFTRLTLIDALIDSISLPIMVAAQATGKIKLYQSVVGGILLLNLPVSWILLVFGAHTYSVMVVAICLTFTAFVMRLLILKRLINFSIIQFFKNVIFPIIAISILSAILPVLFYNILKDGLLRLFVTIGISIISICCAVYFLGISKNERQSVNKIIINRIHKVV
jgi:hypothetical protein